MIVLLFLTTKCIKYNFIFKKIKLPFFYLSYNWTFLEKSNSMFPKITGNSFVINKKISLEECRRLKASPTDGDIIIFHNITKNFYISISRRSF